MLNKFPTLFAYENCFLFPEIFSCSLITYFLALIMLGVKFNNLQVFLNFHL